MSGSVFSGKIKKKPIKETLHKTRLSKELLLVPDLSQEPLYDRKMEEWKGGLVCSALSVELAVHLPFRVDTGGSGYEAGVWPLRSGILENIPWLS